MGGHFSGGGGENEIERVLAGLRPEPGRPVTADRVPDWDRFRAWPTDRKMEAFECLYLAVWEERGESRPSRLQARTSLLVTDARHGDPAPVRRLLRRPAWRYLGWEDICTWPMRERVNALLHAVAVVEHNRWDTSAPDFRDREAQKWAANDVVELMCNDTSMDFVAGLTQAMGACGAPDDTTDWLAALRRWAW